MSQTLIEMREIFSTFEMTINKTKTEFHWIHLHITSQFRVNESLRLKVELSVNKISIVQMYEYRRVKWSQVVFREKKKTNTKHMDGFKEKTSERKRKSEEERYSNRNTKYNTCDYFLCIQITAKIASIWIMSNTHRKINKTNITIAIIKFCSSWKSIQNIYGEKNLFAIRNSERAFNQRYLRLRDKF